MRSAAANDDVYFGWGLQKERASGGRGTSQSVVAVPGFMMDIDLKASAPGIHANDNLPESVDDMMNLIEELGFLIPTQVRHSGNGIYGDWLLPKMWSFASEDDRAKAAQLSKRLQQALIEASKQLRGWKLDNTSDLARVTRMPGTRNHKTNPPKDVTILEVGSGQRYTVEELEAAIVNIESRFGQPERLLRKARNNSRRSGKSEFSVANDNEPRLAPIVTGCAWAAQAVKNAGRMPEPVWYALAGIAGRCKGGEAEFHEISVEDSRYDPVETQEKLEHAMESAGPRTCASVSNHFDGCRNCPFNGKITSPIQLGHISEVQARLMRDYVFDVGAEAYIEVSSGKYLDERQFSNKFRHETGKHKPHTMMTTHGFTRKVDCSRYIPGNYARFLRRDGEDVFNTWRPGGVEPEPGGDASLILEHLEYLYADSQIRDYFLDCLASLIQAPERKITHVLLMIGRQGTGKSFLAGLLSRMVGRRNIKTVNSDGLNAEWTENLLDCQILVLEEVMTKGRKDVYNRMKLWVTDDTALANQKNRRVREAATPRLVIGFSNHAVPVSLEPGDRRFFVMRSDVEPRDADYYEQLFGKGMSQVGAFLSYLQRRDISSFNPSARPPMTDAKEEIIADGLPRAEQALRELLECDNPVLKKDVVTFASVRTLIGSHIYGANVSDNQLTEALRAIGAANLDQVRLGQGRRERLWAIRDTDKWKSASPDELRAYLRSFAT